MSYTDYENKVCVDPKTLVDEGLSIFDFQSQCLEMFLDGKKLIVGFDEMFGIPFGTELSKKEVGTLVASLKKLYEKMED